MILYYHISTKPGEEAFRVAITENEQDGPTLSSYYVYKQIDESAIFTRVLWRVCNDDDNYILASATGMSKGDAILEYIDAERALSEDTSYEPYFLVYTK